MIYGNSISFSAAPAEWAFSQKENHDKYPAEVSAAIKNSCSLLSGASPGGALA
jgi:hypothetical protein